MRPFGGINEQASDRLKDQTRLPFDLECRTERQSNEQRGGRFSRDFAKRSRVAP